MKKLIFYFLLIIILTSCKELYLPEVESTQRMITVEALITQEEEFHQVFLYYTDHFNDLSRREGVVGAHVWIADNFGKHYLFEELFWLMPQDAGRYQARYPFKAEAGREYVLHITTRDGTQIRSRPQQLLPMAEIEQFSASFGLQEYLSPTSSGGHIVRNFPGVDVRIDIGQAPDGIPRMRYESRILQLYHYRDTLDFVTYFWKTLNDPAPPNVNFPGITSGQAGLRDHPLLFVPLTENYYGIPDSTYMSGRYILIRKYRLNEDSYTFYKQLNQQLSADGHIFDPIAAQIDGNMFSTTHPEMSILGLFEVSFLSPETYSIFTVPGLGLIEIKAFEDLESIPYQGEVFEDMPFFWRWS